jgi:RimJ/RimL family protein N-acetyltransferase
MNQEKTFDSQPTLVGKKISLFPLKVEDFEELFLVASDPLIWEQHPERYRYQKPVFEKFFSGAMASKGALIVVDTAQRKVIGTSRYYDLNPADDSVAIGFTFLAREYWGTNTNKEMKQLMIQHAFTYVKKVWFHIGPSNIRSRKAIEKIGATYSHEETKVLNGAGQPFVFYKMEKGS